MTKKRKKHRKTIWVRITVYDGNKVISNTWHESEIVERKP